MPEVIIAANWKMNTTLLEAKDLVTEMKSALVAIEGVEVVLCPPFISLPLVRDLLEGSGIAVGAQNMHFEESGAFTGEVSPRMLADLCQFVILGHSERRQLFGETDELINKKVKAALDVGLIPMLCVGEQLQEREEGSAESVVGAQVHAALSGIQAPNGLVIAYEPVWAIGTGRAATPADAQAVMAHIRKVVGSLYGDNSAADISLLYGGSVNADNAAGFLAERDINGALVGGASLKAESFVSLVGQAAHVAS